MTQPARKTQLPVSHYISRVINFGDQAAATGQQIGTVPAGCYLGTTKVLTTTAWNGTTSVALSVGTTLTGTDLINGTDVRTAAARVDTVVPIAKVLCAVDTPIYASVAFGGTVGTAGSSAVVLTYEPAIF